MRTTILIVLALSLALPAACDDDDGSTGHTDAELCAVVTCAGNAHCEVTPARVPICVCDPGLVDNAGVCLPPADPCLPNPCVLPFQHQCTVESGLPVCGCDDGYVDNGFGGCQPEAGDPCDPNPCDEPDRGQCVPLALGAVCNCDPGFVEDIFGDCVPVAGDPCAPNPCDEQHRGVCVDDSGFARCDCDSGYSEDIFGACVPDVDPCENNPCTTVPNQTECAPGPDGSAICSCASGFKDDGAGGCEPVLVDPCEDNPCTAPHKTRCAASGDQAVCSCDEGWHDDGVGGCTDDDCVPNPCTTTGQTACTASGVGVICGCDDGWVSDGQGGCELEETGPCDPNPCGETLQTVCVEQGDGYRCDCEAVAHPDGEGGCTLDPCLPNPCSATHQSACVADTGEASGYRCDCDTDYHLHEGACVDACTPNPCDEQGKGTCTANAGQASCSCDPNLHDDGQGGCTSDPCLPNPCGADEICVVASDNVATSCVACADGDGDDYGVGEGCLGRDCDDEDISVHEGCVCDGAHSTGDEYEEDECFFLATELTSGETQGHTITPAPDTDWVRFTVAAGDMITLRRAGIGSLTLYDRDGTTVVEGPASSAFIDRKLPAAGEYFAKVWHHATGPYDITYTFLGQDDHGDTTADATLVLADGSTMTGSNEINGNVDWFAFDAVAGRQYRIEAKALDGQGILLDLYAPDGTTDLEGRSASYNSTVVIDREDLVTGRYFIKVRENYGSAPAGRYELTVTDLGADDHGDTFGAATSLTTDGAALAADFEVGGNVDWFSFTAVEGHLYQIEATGAGMGMKLGLYDTDGETLIEERSTGYSSVAFIDREGLPSGTYYLRVAPNYGNTYIGDYTVLVRDLGLDDHGNDAGSATAIDVGVEVDGLFEVGGNVDWLSFEVIAGHDYQFRASCEGCGIHLQLVAADTTAIIEEKSASYSSTAFIDRAGLVAGTHYLRLRPNYGNTDTGAWHVEITDLGLDDHADRASEATTIAADGQTVDALFEVGGDVDWFQFDAQSDHQYRITAKGEGMGVKVLLHAPDGMSQIEERAASYSSTASLDREDLDTDTYFIRVAPNYGNTSYGAYTLRIDDLGLDDHGDSADEATPVATDNVEVGGVFEVGGNIDWFEFDVTAGHIYNIVVRTNGTGAKVDLYAPDATTVLVERTATHSGTPRIGADDLAAGTHYIRVRPYNGSISIGPYSIAIEDLGVDDHGQTAATATPLATDGAVIQATFEVSGNEDWYSFQATDGVLYAITCTPGNGQGCKGTVFPANATTELVNFSSTYSSSVTSSYVSNGSGQRYLRIKPNYGSAYQGDYEISITAQ